LKQQSLSSSDTYHTPDRLCHVLHFDSERAGPPLRHQGRDRRFDALPAALPGDSIPASLRNTQDMELRVAP